MTDLTAINAKSISINGVVTYGTPTGGVKTVFDTLTYSEGVQIDGSTVLGVVGSATVPTVYTDINTMSLTPQGLVPPFGFDFVFDGAEQVFDGVEPVIEVLA